MSTHKVDDIVPSTPGAYNSIDGFRPSDTADGYYKRQVGSEWRPEGITRAAGPVVAVASKKSAAGTWKQAFEDAKVDAAIIDGIIEIDPLEGGVYPITGANLDLSTHRVRWTGQARLQPGAGVQITMPKTWDAGFYQIIDDSAGGTFNYESTEQREFRPEWWGAKSDRVTRSDLAIQKANNAAYGAPGARHVVAGVDKNKHIIYGAGWYMFDDEVDATNIYGWHVNGPGRESCSLIQRTTGKRLFNCDTTSYFSIRGISFGYLSLVNSAKELINFDTSGAFPGSSKTQQGTIEDCSFNGELSGGVCDIAIQIAYSGGQAQGDTILIKNVGGFGFGFAYIAIGDRAAIQPPAYNALGIMLISGDIQGCMKYGVYCYGGQIFVDGTSCQNNQTMGQLDGGGFDFYFPIFAQGSVLKNVRSESCCLTNAQSSSDGIVIENCDVHCGNVLIGGWSSATAYPQGALWMFSGAQSNASGAYNPTRQSGRPYMAWAGGVSGADGNEPNMTANDSPYSLPPVYSRTFTTSAASVHVTVGPGIWQAAHVGWKVFLINPVTLARDYRTIVAVNNSVDISLDAAPSFSGVNVTVRAGKAVVDGTVTWVAYDFNNVEGSISYVLGGMYQCGRFVPGAVFPRFILFPRTSRKDVWAGASPGAYNVGVGLGPHHGIIAFLVGQGNAQGTLIPHPNLNTDPNSNSTLMQAGLSLGDGILFDGGDGGWQWASVGLVRGDAAHFYDAQAGQKSVAGVVGTLGKVVKSTADTIGDDFDQQPGMGTGTRGSGNTNRWYQPAGGASGVAQSNRALADRIEAETGRYISFRGRAVSTAAATAVAAAGHYTPDAAAKMSHRVRANGATMTVDNPVNLVDGSRIMLDIANASGGVTAIGLDTKYLGVFPAPANGKRRTQLYEYDLAADKLVPLGAQSGDL